MIMDLWICICLFFVIHLFSVKPVQEDDSRDLSSLHSVFLLLTFDSTKLQLLQSVTPHHLKSHQEASPQVKNMNHTLHLDRCARVSIIHCSARSIPASFAKVTIRYCNAASIYSTGVMTGAMEIFVIITYMAAASTWTVLLVVITSNGWSGYYMGKFIFFFWVSLKQRKTANNIFKNTISQITPVKSK